MFKPIRKTRVYEEIVLRVREMIETGLLKTGERLPTERDLAETFKVSRASVREALRALECQGFLESRQGDGTYVVHQPVDLLVEPLVASIVTWKHDQEQLFEMRRILEPQMARLAAERATPEEIGKMEAILQAQRERIGLGEPAEELDRQFHHSLIEAAGNTVLLRIVNTITGMLAETRDIHLQGDGRPERSVLHHQRVLEAIREGNGEGAAEAMLEHLEAVEMGLFTDGAGEGSLILGGGLGRSSEPVDYN
ncbi:MAG: FadR family transcriptional regulator [bacterium]|nr:MAG: FadR family transcriptional regulator [bacterium]